MKAPDKIYLQVCGDCPLEKKECESCEFSNLEGNVTWCIDKIFEKDIVYIRKDALLEWAKTNKEKCGTILEDDFWQEVIDKLNSM